MPTRLFSIVFFFMVHLFYEYVQLYQLNTRDRKKPSQQEQTFFLQRSSFFLRASVSGLLKRAYAPT